LAVDEERIHNKEPEEIREYLHELSVAFYELKEEEVGAEGMREIERVITLRTIDENWIDHLNILDHLREGVGLRGYAQVDPIVVYAQEAYEMFDALKERVGTEVITKLFRVAVRKNQDIERKSAFSIHGMGRGAEGGVSSGKQTQVKRTLPKVGRNDPCPCGSGKKYKQCCGKAEAG
jgi:preprotein translocase subunit SecA